MQNRPRSKNGHPRAHIVRASDASDETRQQLRPSLTQGPKSLSQAAGWTLFLSRVPTHSRDMAVKTSRRLAHLRRLGHLHPGDHLHLIMSQGCVDREVVAELPGGNYLRHRWRHRATSDGLELSPARSVPSQDGAHHSASTTAGARLHVPSATQQGVVYKVQVSPTGHPGSATAVPVPTGVRAVTSARCSAVWRPRPRP